MEAINAFFFSGTGNTRYVTEHLAKQLSDCYEVRLFNIESQRNFATEIRTASKIIIAFPIYGSTPPVPIRQFVNRYADCFDGREVIIIVTEYMFSGDGAESLGRWIRRHGGQTDFEEHIMMPNNLSDFKAFKIHNGSDLAKTLMRADRRISAFATAIKEGRPFRRGKDPFSHALGYFSQRSFWRRREEKKFSLLQVDETRCVGCGLCASSCPVQNLRVQNGKAIPSSRCVLCYRCVNLCPRQALTLLGKTPPLKQYRGPFVINSKTRE